jgi:thiol-disulfide isomerase/thioredoxin
MIDFDDIRGRTTTVKGYIDALREKDKDIVMEAYEEYSIKQDIVDELRTIMKGMKVIVFSAPWCGDCKRAMPVLLHLEEMLNLDIMVFGTIKTAPLDPKVQWAVPPSPPEINAWGVKAIPWFIFYNDAGEEVGVLIEKPKVKDTLEEEILYVLKN